MSLTPSYKEASALETSNVAFAALPAVACCPRCGRRELFVYHDVQFNAVWSRCTACNYRQQAVRDGSHTFDVAMLDRWDAFYERAITNELDETHSILRRHLDLGIVSEVTRIIPRMRQFRLFGQASAEEFVAAFNESGWELALADNKVTKYVIIPFYDLPGRLAAFALLASGPAGLTTDLVTLPHILDMQYRQTSVHDDLGICCAPAIAQATERVFTATTLTALRLQARHLNDHEQLLPLVGVPGPAISYTTNPVSRAYWGAIPHITPSFLTNQYTLPIVVKHAANVGLISIFDDFDQGTLPIAAKLNALQIDAKKTATWINTVTRELKTVPPEQFTGYIDSLELPPDLKGQLLTTLAESPQFTHLVRSFQEAIRECVVTTGEGARVLREQHNGWFTESGALASNTVMRIERKVGQRPGPCYYCGHLRQHERVYPFADKAGNITVNPREWVQKTLVQHDDATPLRYAPRFCPSLVEAAEAFYAPHVERQFPTLGWNARRSCFEFPNVCITSNGNFAESRGFHLQGPTPGEEFTLTNLSVPDYASAMTYARNCYLAVAALSAVGAQIVAPTQGFRPKHVVLAGAATYVYSAVQKVWGCPVIELDGNVANNRRLLEEYSHTCQWPAAVAVKDTAGVVATLDAIGRENCPPFVFRMPSRHKELLARLQLDAQVVYANNFDYFAIDTDKYRVAMFSWLRSLCERNFKLRSFRKRQCTVDAPEWDLEEHLAFIVLWDIKKFLPSKPAKLWMARKFLEGSDVYEGEHKHSA